jgi:hypothetical protein
MRKRDWSNVDWTQTNEQIAASLGGIARETVARERARQGVATVRPKRLTLQVAELSDALRQIATAIGTPAHVDPLADLPGLVLAVQAVVQRAESSAIVAAERDRRIDPVEHARAVMRAYMLTVGGVVDEGGARWRWGRSRTREDLLARVGPDVLAEVER